LSVSFLTPLAGLVAFAVVFPLVAFARTENRIARVRSRLRLGPPRASRATMIVLPIIAVLVGIGAAQPVVEQWEEHAARTDAQAFFAFDTSRSMLASSGPGEPTRFDRAVTAARRMRAALGELPVGVASLTDRVLPHVFPTANPRSFDAVLRYSIAVERPASDEGNNKIASSLEATSAFASGNYFRGAPRRLLVVFTDAETRAVGAAALGQAFANARIETIVVRVGSQRDRIYRGSRIETVYVPQAGSREAAASYASVVRGRAFDEDQLDDAITAARSMLGSGGAVTRAEIIDIRPLGPYVFLAALVPLSFLLLRRNLV